MTSINSKIKTYKKQVYMYKETKNLKYYIKGVNGRHVVDLTTFFVLGLISIVVFKQGILKYMD